MTLVLLSRPGWLLLSRQIVSTVVLQGSEDGNIINPKDKKNPHELQNHKTCQTDHGNKGREKTQPKKKPLENKPQATKKTTAGFSLTCHWCLYS